jgi:PAS domain S-box-containing protein
MTTDSYAVFEGQGEVRGLLRELDWSTSVLGHPSLWPVPLRTAVDMVLSSSFPMFVAWGDDLGFIYNDAYAVIMGQKHPDALGGRFQDIWAEIWADIEPIVARALANKSSFFEDLPLTVVRRGYPEESYFTFSYSPLHDTRGLVGGMYCTVIESTSRVLAEHRSAFELKVSDALRQLTAPQDVVITASALIGGELKLARVIHGEGDAGETSFFVRRDWTNAALPSLAGMTFQLDDFGPVIADALRNGEVVSVSDSACDPRTAQSLSTAAMTGVRAFIAVPLIKKKRIVAILALQRGHRCVWNASDLRLAADMAERTWSALETARAQAELRAERDNSRYIFDTIGEGFMLLDCRWCVLQMNADGMRITQKSDVEVLGRHYWDVWPEAVGTDAALMYQRVMETGEAGIAEYAQSHEGGSTLWIEVRAYPTREGGVAMFFRDVTDRRSAEQQFRDGDKRKDEFLAMLAHELRNPLAPILAAAELLKIGKVGEDQVQRSSAVIGRQVKHMIGLVNDLLDVSRVTRGLVTLAKAPVSTQAFVEDAVEQVKPLMQARRQQLVIHAPDQETTVLGDKARLVQVVANLLNNASKFSAEECQIQLSANIDGEFLEVVVQDQGIGMEADLTAHVFELFTQAQRSSDRSLGGLGLGLALVKNLVELHGGTVSCSSPGPRLGSTFMVRLPLMLGLPPADERHGEALPQAGGGLKMLVVDDNVDAAQSLAMLLEACGHEVVVEHEAVSALVRIEAERFDVCLLDIGLPVMDGNVLARKVRSLPAKSRVTLIAVTGYGQEKDRQQSTRSGFDHHLVKPVSIEELARALASRVS